MQSDGGEWTERETFRLHFVIKNFKAMLPKLFSLIAFFVTTTIAANCPAVTPPANGRIVYFQANLANAQQSGTTVLLQCDIGIIANGPTSALCGVDGVWNVDLASTRADWSNIENDKKFDQSARVDATDNRWSVICACKCTCPQPVECPALTVLNGFIGYDPFRPRKSGTSATLFCNLGWMAVGNSVAICGPSGAWSTTLGTCNQVGNSLIAGVQCPVLAAVVNGQVNYDPFRPRMVTSAATLMCNMGYMPNGPTLVICNANAAWSDNLGVCNQVGNLFGLPFNGVQCPMLTVLNGQVNYDPIRPRQATTGASLLCNPGYLPSGNTMVTCNGGGTWSDSLGTCNLSG